MTSSVRQFGPFSFDEHTEVLTRSGAPLPLGRRSARLLGVLLRKPGVVLTKQELMDAAWPNLTVVEANLSVQIAQLRRHLGKAPSGAEWIATVSGVGYRLVAPSDSQAAPQAPEPILAVLPFKNLTGAPEQDYFAEGIVEEIVIELSRFRTFVTIAHMPPNRDDMDVPQMAGQLGARYLLEGSVQCDGRRLRIMAQLLDGINGACLWGERFEGELAAVFDIQDRVTERVATLIEPTIRDAEISRARRKSPENLDAYDLYLQAMPLVLAGSTQNLTAIDLLEKAVALAPEFAHALAKAALAYEHRCAMGYSPAGPQDRMRCLELVDAALARSDNQPYVLANCGSIILSITHDYERGLLFLRRARETAPHDLSVARCCAIGELLGGDLDCALELFDRDLSLLPFSRYNYLSICGTAHALMACGDFEQALTYARRSVAANPTFAAGHWNVIASNAHLGQLAEAKDALSAYLRLFPGATLARIRVGQHAKDQQRVRVIQDGLQLAGMPLGQ